MELKEFNKFYDKYRTSDLDTKIQLYCTTEGLTEDQYMKLLRAFPVNKISLLEKALG